MALAAPANMPRARTACLTQLPIILVPISTAEIEANAGQHVHVVIFPLDGIALVACLREFELRVGQILALGEDLPVLVDRIGSADVQPEARLRIKIGRWIAADGPQVLGDISCLPNRMRRRRPLDSRKIRYLPRRSRCSRQLSPARFAVRRRRLGKSRREAESTGRPIRSSSSTRDKMF